MLIAQTQQTQATGVSWPTVLLALAPSVVAIFVVIYNTTVAAKNERKKWLREHRLEIYSSYFAALEDYAMKIPEWAFRIGRERMHYKTEPRIRVTNIPGMPPETDEDKAERKATERMNLDRLREVSDLLNTLRRDIGIQQARIAMAGSKEAAQHVMKLEPPKIPQDEDQAAMQARLLRLHAREFVRIIRPEISEAAPFTLWEVNEPARGEGGASNQGTDENKGGGGPDPVEP